MRHRYGLLLVIALMVITVGVRASPIHIHMSWEEDPRYSITVSWRTESVTPSVIEYGVTLPYESRVTGALAKVHHVALTGLEPTPLYHFRCGHDGDWSEDLTFKTAPDDPTEPFTFVAFGDSRTNWDVWGECSEAVLASGAAFSVHTGDLVIGGGNQNEWDIWFEEGKELLSRRVMMPAIGNHEDNDPKYYEQFALPYPEDWYSFDYGNVHFTILSTEKDMAGAQRDWLEHDLSSTNATWKFVFYHRPMYSSSSHGCYRKAQAAWGDLFDEYHVDMVFNGHDHTYERSYPMYDDWLSSSPENGTIHIVTGGAGAPLRGLVARGPWCAYFLSHYHFVLLSINGTELHMEARFYNQTVFDKLDLSKAEIPDLTIESFTINPTYPSPGELATIRTIIGNTGREQSGECNMSIVIDEEILSTSRVPSLPPGAGVTLETEWTPEYSGLYNVTVWADSDDEILEGIWETNNKFGMIALVSEPKPDLVVTDLGCDNIMPEVGESINFRVEVKNMGTGSSGPFNLSVMLNDTPFYLSTCLDCLGPGEGTQFTYMWSCTWGDWKFTATVDPSGKVDEIFEDNNLANRTFWFRDFTKEGAAYISQGFHKGESAVVYYNQSEGEIPDNSSTCTVVWGMNGWKKPPIESPPDTVALTLFETKMQRISDHLWLAVLPTCEEMEWIDLKFEDRQVLSRYWDTNNGSYWMVPGLEWVNSKFDDLIATIEDALAVGVDVSPYWDAIAEANITVSKGQYIETIKILINATDCCRIAECEALLESATSEYEKAIGEGIDLPRVLIFLNAAENQMKTGNYYGSMDYSRTVLRFISEAREQINEYGFVAVLLMSLAFPIWRIWNESCDKNHNRC